MNTAYGSMLVRCLLNDRVKPIPMAKQKAEPETKPPKTKPPKTEPDAAVDWVLLALSQTSLRRWLLQQRSHLNDILKSIPARRLLFERATLSATASERQQALALIVDIMKASRKIWRGGAISPQIYDEAIAHTWDWFCDKISTYDPARASFVTWFNHRLKWQILDESRLPLPEPPEAALSDIEMPNPYAWENLLDEWISLVAKDQQLMRCRMQQHLRLSCQNLLLSILQALQETGEFSWEAIAKHPILERELEPNIEPEVIKRFCRRRCFARFKELTGS